MVLKTVIEVAVEPADVGARAAHVETDNALVAGLAARHRGSDNPAGRAAQQTVLGSTVGAGDEAARAAHHAQFAAGQLALHAVEVARHDRRQVGIDNRRFSARQNLYHRRQLARHGDVPPAGVAEVCGQALFVVGIAMTVEADDGGGLVFIFRRLNLRESERAKHLAKRVKPFIDANDVRRERRRFLDVKREQIRAFLIADE